MQERKIKMTPKYSVQEFKRMRTVIKRARPDDRVVAVYFVIGGKKEPHVIWNGQEMPWLEFWEKFRVWRPKR